MTRPKLTFLPIPPESEVFPNEGSKVPGEIYFIEWNKIISPVSIAPPERYFVPDVGCTYLFDWSASSVDNDNLLNRFVHLSAKKALLHRMLLLKLNLNAVRTSFEGSCVMVSSKFPAPLTGDLVKGTKIWSVGLTAVTPQVWDNTLAQQLLRAYGLLHLKKDECETHRQCWIEANLRGIEKLDSTVNSSIT